MNYENICISCFKEKVNSVCEHCGYVEEEKRRSSLLPARMLLNGRYILGEIINVDKSSVEYKAWDTKENRTVEIQEYYPRAIVTRNASGYETVVNSKENEEAYLKNIERIARNAKKMYEFSKSPYIVNIFDSFEANNTVYIVKEYIEGLTLSDFVESSGGKVDSDTAISIMVPVLDGLTQLHKAGLVHRALTPKSIIITTDNKIKIEGFRFLKEASPYRDEEMTIHFTPGYAPPEQYRAKSKQGAFSDIYSAGAILYRIITGKRAADALNRINEDNFIAPKEINPNIPDSLNISIVKAMNLTAELRFKSASDFKNSLTEKKEVVDIDSEIETIKAKKFNQKTVALLVGVAAIAAFILYKILC